MGQKSNFYVEVRSLHSEVTGSCFVCKISFANGEKKFFLVDIGMFQEKDYMDWNERLTFNPEDLSFVLLTHNHVDHVGRLPMIYHRGCTAKTYASVGTAMALPISLEDSFKIMQEKNKKSKKVLMRPGNRNDMMKDNYYFPKLFNKEDLRRTFLNLEKVQYNRWIEPENINGVSFKFLPNAHLPGASMIWVKIEEKTLEQTVNLLFVGDWNERNVFQGKFDFPEELRDVPLHIVCEATYGNTKRVEIQKSFEQNIQEAVEKRKIILLPVISQYRAQEMLWYMKRMKAEGIIPEDTPIYFSGPLGLKYMMLYQNENFPDFLPGMKDFLPTELKIIDSKCSLGELEMKLEFGIYVITGGMGSNGPSASYLRLLLSNPGAFIQFSSYCAEGTLGRKLQEVPRGEEVFLGSTVVRKLADVRFTSELSGHAKSDELLEFLSGFKKIKTLLVTHGGKSQKEAFCKLVDKANIAKEATILDRNNYVRLNPWGILDKKTWKD